MNDILKIIEMADKYDLDITIRRNVLDIRRYILGTRDWVKSIKVYKSDIEDLNITFEQFLKTIDEDFTASYERFQDTGEYD